MRALVCVLLLVAVAACADAHAKKGIAGCNHPGQIGGEQAARACAS